MAYTSTSAVLLKKTKKAFSTGEVLLAMFILSIGLITVVALVSKSLKYSLFSRDIIIAAELAQEGVELVRNVRDNDFAGGGDGFDQSDSFQNSQKYCRIDFDDSSEGIDCDNASESPERNPSRYYLQYSPAGFYAHYSSTRERFSRFLYIDYNTAGAGSKNALVRSFVYWGDASPPPSDGDPGTCIPANACVFTELYLTSWK